MYRQPVFICKAYRISVLASGTALQLKDWEIFSLEIQVQYHLLAAIHPYCVYGTQGSEFTSGDTAHYAFIQCGIQRNIPVGQHFYAHREIISRDSVHHKVVSLKEILPLFTKYFAVALFLNSKLQSPFQGGIFLFSDKYAM